MARSAWRRWARWGARSSSTSPTSTTPSTSCGCDMPRVRTASMMFECFRSLQTHHADMVRRAIGMHAGGHPNAPGMIKPPTEVDDAIPALAIVRQGRWIAYCPNCEVRYGGVRGGHTVGSANNVEPGHPMMCPECCNEDIGGKWRAVVWPEQKEDIEAVLGIRTQAQYQNWEYGQTVSELRIDNIANPDKLIILIGGHP
ncbi:MAG: hypothetical protein KGL39_31635 [Patescibacteria group bacterium]|nr:hypothetical protein [Patescibacteria group bacterium]